MDIRQTIQKHHIFYLVYRFGVNLFYSAKRIRFKRFRKNFRYKSLVKYLFTRKSTLSYRYGVDTEGISYQKNLA